MHGAWQTGESQEIIPDTVADSGHDRLALLCARCNTQLVSDSQIHRALRGFIWTNGVPNALRQGTTRYDAGYNTPYADACCTKCHASVGRIYSTECTDASGISPGGAYPRVKLTIARDNWQNTTIIRSHSRTDMMSIFGSLYKVQPPSPPARARPAPCS